MEAPGNHSCSKKRSLSLMHYTLKSRLDVVWDGLDNWLGAVCRCCNHWWWWSSCFCFRCISNSAWCDVCRGLRLCLSWGRRWSNLLWPVFATRRMENNRIFLFFTLWEMNNCLEIRIWFNLNYSGRMLSDTLRSCPLSQPWQYNVPIFDPIVLKMLDSLINLPQCEYCKPALEAPTPAQLSIAESVLSRKMPRWIPRVLARAWRPPRLVWQFRWYTSIRPSCCLESGDLDLALLDGGGKGGGLGRIHRTTGYEDSKREHSTTTIALQVIGGPGKMPYQAIQYGYRFVSLIQSARSMTRFCQGSSYVIQTRIARDESQTEVRPNKEMRSRHLFYWLIMNPELHLLQTTRCAPTESWEITKRLAAIWYLRCRSGGD